jgi:hypothetical protein
LAAASLATALCDVTGMSLSVGLNSAMTTLTGQARGFVVKKKKRSRGKEMTTTGTKKDDEDERSGDAVVGYGSMSDVEVGNEGTTDKKV